jgi:hypothetical protein
MTVGISCNRKSVADGLPVAVRSSREQLVETIEE